jgi:hypothetical protein
MRREEKEKEKDVELNTPLIMKPLLDIQFGYIERCSEHTLCIYPD